MRPGTIGWRRTQNLSLQITGAFNTQRLSTHNREWRLVIDHHNGCHWRAGVLVKKFDERVDIRKSKGKCTCCDLRNCVQRALPGRNFDLQACLAKVPFVDCHKIRCRRSFEFPVERKRNRRLGMGRSSKEHPGNCRYSAMKHLIFPFLSIVKVGPHAATALGKCEEVSGRQIRGKPFVMPLFWAALVSL